MSHRAQWSLWLQRQKTISAASILLHRTEKAVLARGRAAISEALTLLEKMAALELFQQMQASNQQRLVGATDNAPKGEGTPPTNKDSKADANDPAADTSSCTGSVVGDGMCSMPHDGHNTLGWDA
eukprot:jgi/Mesvir1/13364/Mv06224-RA.1